MKNVRYLAKELDEKSLIKSLTSLSANFKKIESPKYKTIVDPSELIQERKILIKSFNVIIDELRKRMDGIIQDAIDAQKYHGLIEKLEIRLIGYWNSDFEPQWPNPYHFVDRTWDKAERELVINHLISGFPMNWQMGYSWCRFQCGKTNNGSKELSDGYYIWPEGLVHYLEAHEIKLPLEFIEHCKTYRASDEKTLFHRERIHENYYNINDKWWLNFK